MNKIDTATAGLPLFDNTRQITDEDIRTIVERAHQMRNEVVIGLIKGALKPLQKIFRARRTSRALHQLSDSVLADIGIERSQIASISQALADGTYSTEAVAAAAPVIGVIEGKKTDGQSELPLAA